MRLDPEERVMASLEDDKSTEDKERNEKMKRKPKSKDGKIMDR